MRAFIVGVTLLVCTAANAADTTSANVGPGARSKVEVLVSVTCQGVFGWYVRAGRSLAP